MVNLALLPEYTLNKKVIFAKGIRKGIGNTIFYMFVYVIGNTDNNILPTVIAHSTREMP